ncbi:MAG: CDP-diacylglycerol--glycerol-3-phosphate 3-phosphatidyltransferase [Planctomycetota bacterium]|jgi:CDP-diacylglycerol--glycerol-3-phosphate 3-phosphatidyltransferase|nr:MAG: CDP-diacylglycerol--glycerol-3-phosphate 3-phosphatidyltransferase [Planctomycetota bacterium]
MERNLAGTQAIKSGRAVLFNLPNQLTGMRFLLSFVLFYLISQELWLASLLVFIFAAFTDWLDGHLARTQNMQSSLGRNLDPLVDKVLICGTFIFLIPIGTTEGWLPPWMVTVVVARELLITGLRNFIEQKGVSFGADFLGKAKMILQCAALISIFINLMNLEWINPTFGFYARAALIYGMLAATLFSGLQYLIKAFQTILSEHP